MHWFGGERPRDMMEKLSFVSSTGRVGALQEDDVSLDSRNNADVGRQRYAGDKGPEE